MKKNITLIIFLLIIMITTSVFASAKSSDVSMQVIEDNVCTIKLNEKANLQLKQLYLIKEPLISKLPRCFVSFLLSPCDTQHGQLKVCQPAELIFESGGNKSNNVSTRILILFCL